MDTKQIEEKLRSLFKNQELKKLLEGGMSYAYEIDGRIIRIPKTQYAERGYETEKAILDYLHGIITCTKLPDVKIVRDPFFFTIHDKIAGIYWSEQEYFSKNDKTKEALAEDCAVFFAQLHSADVSKIKAELLDLHPIKKNMETYLTEYFSPAETDQILKFTDSLYGLGDKVLVHRDFYSDNFLLTDDYRLNGVLDFGNSGIYNYMFDFKGIASWERGVSDFFKRIAPRYTRITGRAIDMEIIHKIDIHNYISFLVYFTKNKDIKDEKINASNHLAEHVNHIKQKMKMYTV